MERNMFGLSWRFGRFSVAARSSWLDIPQARSSQDRLTLGHYWSHSPKMLEGHAGNIFLSPEKCVGIGRWDSPQGIMDRFPEGDLPSNWPGAKPGAQQRSVSKGVLLGEDVCGVAFGSSFNSLRWETSWKVPRVLIFNCQAWKYNIIDMFGPRGRELYSTTLAETNMVDPSNPGQILLKKSWYGAIRFFTIMSRDTWTSIKSPKLIADRCHTLPGRFLDHILKRTAVLAPWQPRTVWNLFVSTLKASALQARGLLNVMRYGMNSVKTECPFACQRRNPHVTQEM